VKICGQAERMSVVRESEVFVMFVTPEGEGTARNILE
jgi:hypothetical protein